MIGVVCAAGLFLLSACNTTASQEGWVYAEPPLPIDTIRAEAKAVSGGILYPLSIMVSEDRLVVCQPDMEQMFSVYRLPDIDYLYSFGKKGKALMNLRQSILNVLSRLTMALNCVVMTVAYIMFHWTTVLF